MREILFFSLRDDLPSLLDEVEQAAPLVYFRMGQFEGSIAPRFLRARDIPRLGEAAGDSTSLCDRFLVTLRDQPVRLRPVGAAVRERNCIDQLWNPDSVTLCPGGLWKGDVLLHGSIATASDSAVAQALMRRYRRLFKARFTRVRAFYVGPEAAMLLRMGRRLTGAVQSPPEYDLKPPS